MSPRSKVQSPKSSRRRSGVSAERRHSAKKKSAALSRDAARLPFIFLNVATTADGKLAPANRHFIPFSSKRDQELLLELRARADAAMAGARTVEIGRAHV